MAAKRATPKKKAAQDAPPKSNVIIVKAQRDRETGLIKGWRYKVLGRNGQVKDASEESFKRRIYAIQRAQAKWPTVPLFIEGRKSAAKPKAKRAAAKAAVRTRAMTAAKKSETRRKAESRARRRAEIRRGANAPGGGFRPPVSSGPISDDSTTQDAAADALPGPESTPIPVVVETTESED